MTRQLPARNAIVRPWPPEPARSVRRRVARNALELFGVVAVAYGIFFAVVFLFYLGVKAILL